MKITVSKLRQIIREEVEKNLIESKLKVGDKVSAKDGSGWWEILELIPDNRTGKTAAKLKMYTPSGGKTAIAYRNTNELSKVRESMDFKVKKNLKEGLATLGLAQKIIEDYPEYEIRDFLVASEPKGFGFFPDEIGDDLEKFLSGLSMKDLNVLEAHLNKKYGNLMLTGFDDYIRDVDRDMPKPGEPPDPQDVHDEFLMWRDDKGEVPLEKLASELGVEPKEINWNGTGLRVINGIVTELL